MSGGSEVTDRAAELRDAFDRAFAEPRPPAPPPSEDLLAIRVASEPYALRLTEVAGLFADRKVTPVPGRASALLGIAGFRGAIVPVYDLQVLLGCPPLETARWLVIAAGTPVAFAFAVQEGHLRLPRSAIVSYRTGENQRRHVREFAHTTEFARPIVHLPSVLEAIRRQVPAAPETQEH
ncbi:MAG TPA: chemotaxis protein CheW [Stellaceae bacterium]|jgi:purine-binding chemotaxis protein CheW|nr:chemotaxis protein CheW [Stellaceae bacterium]